MVVPILAPCDYDLARDAILALAEGQRLSSRSNECNASLSSWVGPTQFWD